MDNMEFDSLLDNSVRPIEGSSAVLEEMNSDDESAGTSDSHEEVIILEPLQEAVEEQAGISEKVDAERNRNIETSPHFFNDDSSLSVSIDYFSPRLSLSQIKHMR